MQLVADMGAICCKLWGDSLVWSQYIHPVVAEVKLYKCKFPILFLEVFWKQRY